MASQAEQLPMSRRHRPDSLGTEFRPCPAPLQLCGVEPISIAADAMRRFANLNARTEGAQICDLKINEGFSS